MQLRRTAPIAYGNSLKASIAMGDRDITARAGALPSGMDSAVALPYEPRSLRLEV